MKNISNEYVILFCAEVDFFVKVSERRKRQQKEQLPVVSPEKIEQSSPSDIIMSMMIFIDFHFLLLYMLVFRQ